MRDCLYNKQGICGISDTLECEGCTCYVPSFAEDLKANTPKSLKHDQGKLRFDLIPPEITTALAEVLTYGCKKYEANSWQGIHRDRYVAATYRHLVSWQSGETHDAESGLHHLKHALCNIAFLLFKDEHRIV